MTTPYKHVPVPTGTDNRSNAETNGVALVKGREAKRRTLARRDHATLHHGANPEQPSLLSGELRCTLTALSPLLVANQQVKVADLNEKTGKALIDDLKALLGETECKLRSLVQELEARPREKVEELAQRKADEDAKVVSDCEEFPKNKSLLFPLQLTGEDTAPVVIPGEGLKGMIQKIIGSFTGAPLDRVDEAWHSYRPNANFPPTNGTLRTIPIAGCVLHDMIDPSDPLKIQPIIDIGRIEWVHGNALKQNTVPPSPVDFGSVGRGTRFAGKERVDRGGGRWRWKDNRMSNDSNASPCQLLRVCFGLDAASELFLTHKGRPLRSHEKHEQALVPDHLFVKIATSRVILTVNEVINHQWLNSRVHAISDDSDVGQLTEDHPLAGKIKPKLPLTAHPLPRKHDLMFFELLLPELQTYADACRNLLDPDSGLIKKCKIISCGQNYYYRWLHADSVKEAVWGWDGQKWLTERRAEFDPWAQAADGKVDALRNLFGYVRMEEASGNEEASTAHPPPALAGRISINYALERVAPTSTLQQRFLAGSGGSGFAVWLQPLAGPKGPSWAKGYVPRNQEDGANRALRTLGDGILYRKASSEVEIQNLATGEFGSKHYLHHKETLGAAAETARGRAHFDLPAFIAARETLKGSGGDAQKKIERRKPLISDQAAIALRVSRPGTTFGFTVRFRDLHPAELGLLALALNPDLIESGLASVPAGLGKTREQCEQAKKIVDPSIPGGRKHGLRLGHGKPLGMGSVVISIDDALLWNDIGSEERKKWDLAMYIEAALKEPSLVLDEALAATLDVLRLDGDAQSYLSQELSTKKSVLDLAKTVRKNHSEASRMQGFA